MKLYEKNNNEVELIIVCVWQVAGSTAQLLVACKVKADPNYASTKRLQDAGTAVKKATDNLVRAAQQAIEHEEEHTLVVTKWVACPCGLE